MILLADWFFCATMRMGPHDTHSFLDTMAALRRPEPDLTEVLDAAAALGSAPPWLQLYALRPLLTVHGRLADSVLAADDSEDELPSEDEAAGAVAPTYGDAELGRRIVRLCEALLSSTDHPLQGPLGEVFAAVVRGAEGARTDLLKTITTVLAQEPVRRSADGEISMPYHDLNDEILPTMAVIAMAELTRRRPAATTQDWLGDHADPLLVAALQGEHGRLALLTAVDAAGRADPHARDDLWRNLWLDGCGAPHLQPDLLDSMARLWYGHPATSDAPSVAALETEAITGDDLKLWSSFRRPDRRATGEFYALLTGHAGGAWDAMAAVLWQSTLWSLAAEVDPAETAARLRRWWQAPHLSPRAAITIHVGTASRNAADHLTLLRWLSQPSGSRVRIDDAPTEQTTLDAGSAVCSPWVQRWHDGWDHNRKNGPAFRFPPSGSAEPLLRLLTAATLSVSLLAAQPPAEANDHLAALAFHAVDALRDHAALLTAIDSGEYIGESPLGPALVAYLWHVNTVLQDAGTGDDHRFNPRLLADFAARTLADGTAIDLDDNVQRARLARQSLGAICVMWLRYAWIRTSEVHSGHSGGRWFDGDPPHALRILISILDRLSLLDAQYRDLKRREGKRRRQAARERPKQPQEGQRGASSTNGVSLIKGLWPPDLMPPALLLRDIYPGDWPDPASTRWPQLDLDWYTQREKLRELYQGQLRHAGGDPSAVDINIVRAHRLLLSPAHPLPIWREFARDLEEWTRVDDAPLTMRALRLVALLKDPTATVSPEYREWIEDWLDWIYAVERTTQLSLDVRSIMIRMLDLTQPELDVEYRRRLTGIHEGTIDALLEFGARTPRHVEMLLDRLAAELDLGREGADRLRLRALETLYRQQRFRRPLLQLPSATGTRRRRMADVNRHLLLRRFLVGLAGLSDERSERIPMLERAYRLWEDTLTSPSLVAHRASLADRRRDNSARVPDLLVAASVTDRYRAEEVSYLLDVVDPEELSRVDGPRVHDLFRSATYRHQRLAGLNERRITAFGVVAASEGNRIWLNVGLGAPLEYEVPSTDQQAGPGDVVAVRLHEVPARVTGITTAPRPTPVPGEIRRATVRTTAPWLRVTVDGVDRNAYPTGDSPAAEAVRMLWDPDLSRAFAPADVQEYSVPARWDPELSHWVPVVRTFNEFIIDELPAAAYIRLVHAGGDRFVTTPGRLYRLADVDWMYPDAVRALLGASSGGLILQVAARTDGNDLRLDVVNVLDKNLRWLQMFSDGEHEFTIATRSPQGYHVTVEPPEGFPAEVVARGAEGGTQRAYVITTPWTAAQARAGEVEVILVPVHGLGNAENPTPERFAALLDIAVGDVLKLRHIFSKNMNDALVWATTETGVAVRLETDSLTLLDPGLVDKSAVGLVRGRGVEVIRMYTPPGQRPAGEPISVVEFVNRVLTRGAVAEDVRRLATTVDTLEGVVVTRAVGGGSDTIYGTWCRLGPAVHFVELGQNLLGGSNAQLVGQTFTGTRTDDHWSFRFTPREITVRGLFTIENRDAEAAEFVGSDGVNDLYQLPNQPILIRQAAVSGDVVRRLAVSGGEVTLIDRRPITARTVVARKDGVVRLGKSTFAGDLAHAEVSGVQLRLSDSHSGDTAVVHARRTFLLVARSAPAARPARQVDYVARWTRFLSSGEQHVIGTITGDSIDIAGGLRAPGPDGRLTARLPLMPAQAPAVAGVPYRSSDARVKLVEYEDGYIASYATAAPKTVGEFMARLEQQVASGDSKRKFADPLYYVGPPTEEIDGHVFEWGYGWTVVVPPDRLSVVGSPDRRLSIPGTRDLRPMPPLFHGDQIVAASFNSADDGDPIMVIDWHDIRPRYVTQITEESGRRYLHLLDVEIGVAEGTLRVLRAQAGRRRGDDPFRSAEWVPLTAALDDRSRELILERLREGGETGLVRRRILARFDAGQSLDSGGRQRLFRAVQAGGIGLEGGDYVFLTAHAIDESSNEITVIFGRPDALNADDLVVRVNRREFSFRETTLARLRDRGLDLASGELVMLVRIDRAQGDGVWRGSVRNAPARRPETLVSYLASRGGNAYAVFGKVQGAGRLEIAPGVLYSAEDVRGAENARPGAIVRLELDDARCVVLTTALPADSSYVTAQGRAAVVLPKSNLLTRNARDRQGGMQRAFVVSGLPDVLASPVADAGVEILASAHPKIGWIWQLSNGAVMLGIATRGRVRAARLIRSSPGQQAVLQPRALPAEPHDDPDQITVPWARMSFANSPAHDIAKACRSYEWQHHDRSTGHVRDGEIFTYRVQPGSMRSDGVFFDDDAGWTLRYRSDQLARFGFPADELLDSAGLDRSLPVAGPSADGDGVWVELGPGRLAEVRGALVTAEGGVALDRFDWSRFAPGDQIRLRSITAPQRTEGWQATQGHLEFKSWRPAITGALPTDDRDARILLPIRGIGREGDAIQLADGRWRLLYPIAREEAAEFETGAVWLDARNDIRPLAGSSVRPGDTVLLGATDNGELTAAGLSGVELRLAPDSRRNWPGSGWLFAALNDPRTRTELLSALDNQLPVTVHSVGLDRPVLTVSREQQPSGWWPRGRQVRTEILATWQRDRLLLRAGSALYSVPVRDVVRGAPPELAGAIATTLAAASRKRQIALWWVIGKDGRPSPGLTQPAGNAVDANEVVVEPEFEVAPDGFAVGVVCREVGSRGLYWLSAAHASWTRDIQAGDLLASLCPARRMVARRHTDQSVSLNTRPSVVHQLRRLSLGQPLRVVLGGTPPRPTDDGRWRYLARVEVPPILLSYVSTDATLEAGSARLTEVDHIERFGQPDVVTVDINSRLVTLDLPGWTFAAHRNIAGGDTADADLRRFEHYARWYRDGLAPGLIPDDPVEAVIRLAGNLLDAEPKVSPECIREVANAWISAYGRAALNLVDNEALDAAPAFAAALALDALGDVDDRWAEVAVLYLHQLGRRAAASLHTEQFATGWIGRPDRHRLGGAWARLRALSLEPQLGPRDVRHLREFCRGMLTKPVLRTAESALAPVARSLLSALGELESAKNLLEDATVLAAPAIWARSLLPPAGFATAQRSLLPPQKRELRAYAERVIADALPLTLLPVVAQPTRLERDVARRTLDELSVS